MEKNVIFYCPNCNSAYGGVLGSVAKCPDCKTELMDTAYDRDAWRELTDSEKNRIKTKWKIQAEELEKSRIEKEKLLKIQKEELVKRLNSHKLTSGYSFEGYKIVEYLDVVSGEVVLGTGLFSAIESSWADDLGVESTTYNNKLKQARESAKAKAIYQSSMLGGNALIGIDIDYITFSSDKIGVIYTGTAVIIEKL